jgi:hypothetical protein
MKRIYSDSTKCKFCNRVSNFSLDNVECIYQYLWGTASLEYTFSVRPCAVGFSMKEFTIRI